MLSENQKERLGIALNEATVVGVEVDGDRHIASVTFAVLSIPQGGEVPEDPRVLLLLSGVRRIAASLRHAHWNDPAAEVEMFGVSQLLSVVRSFEGQPIYGWEFFDRHQAELEEWGHRLSLDWQPSLDEGSQSLLLFQESAGGPARHLDLLIWFDGLSIQDPEGQTVSVDDFIAGGERWWRTFREGGELREGPDGSMIVPLQPG